MNKITLNHTYYLSFIQLTSIPISILCSVLLARNLGIEDFGQYTLLLTLAPVLGLPVYGGMITLLTRYISKYQASSSYGHIKGITLLSIIWVLTLSTFIIGFSHYTYLSGISSTTTGNSYLSYALFIIPLSGLICISNGICRGSKMPIQAGIPLLIIHPLLLLLVISGLVTNQKLTLQNAFISQLVALCIALAAGYFFTKRAVKPALEAKISFEIKEWSHSLLPIFFLAGVNTLNAHVGILILSANADNEAIAALRVADRMAILLALPLAIANSLISPFIVEAWSQKDNARIRQLALKTARYTFLASLPVAIAFTLFGRHFVELIFGSEYTQNVYTPLLILIAGQMLNIFVGPAGQILIMCGFEKSAVIAQTSGFIVTVVLCYLLSSTLGAIGASIGISLGVITWNIFAATEVYRKVNIRMGAY